jgi:hypothetical protein
VNFFCINISLLKGALEPCAFNMHTSQ